MIELTLWNAADSMPKKGDTIVISTKKNKDGRYLAMVKDVVNDNEIILQKSTNSFFDWDMYMAGDSWVYRVWVLKDVTPTTASNSLINFYDV